MLSVIANEYMAPVSPEDALYKFSAYTRMPLILIEFWLCYRRNNAS